MSILRQTRDSKVQVTYHIFSYRFLKGAWRAKHIVRETDYGPVLRDRCRRGSEKKGKRESDQIFRVFPFSSSSSSSFLVVIVVVVIIIIIIITYNIIVIIVSSLNTASRWLAVGKQEILQQMFRKFQISNRLPNRYFPKIAAGCPCVYVSHQEGFDRAPVSS